MKLCKKTIFVLSIFLGINFFSLLAQAAIPFTEAIGVYKGTKTEYKQISPFWGLVALHTNVLQQMRFFGNYSVNTIYDENNQEHKVDIGNDPIAILIKRLFNSPDGVQFVATTYNADPVGNLSRNLEAINSIIEALVNSIESPQEKITIENNRIENKKEGESSFFLKNELINTIKNILDQTIKKEELEKAEKSLLKEKYQSEIEPEIQSKYKKYSKENAMQISKNLTQILQNTTFLELVEEAKQRGIRVSFSSGMSKNDRTDIISSLMKDNHKPILSEQNIFEIIKNFSKKQLEYYIKRLKIAETIEFPLNERDARKLAENEIIKNEAYKQYFNKASDEKLKKHYKEVYQTDYVEKQQEKNNLIHDLSQRKLKEILKNDFFNLYAKQNNLKIENIESRSQEELIKLFSSQEAQKKILETENENITDILFVQMKKRNFTFAKQLVEAYFSQKEFANPEKQNQQLYPENIVIISLLSFFSKVANSKEDFKKLPFLMSQVFDTQEKFSKESYFYYREEYKNLKNKKDYLEKVSSDPELYFLLTKGFDIFEDFLVEPIEYRADICFKNSREFPDCGETSLRNVLMMLLGDHGNISESAFENVKKNIKTSHTLTDPNEPFQKMIGFFERHPFLEKASIKDAHTEWSEVVSDLNKNEKGLNAVQYSDRGAQKNYEIKANFSNIGVNGILNMLNVIAKIFPDEQLKTSWSTEEQERYQQASQKLDRLCEILTWEDHEITWENENTKDSNIEGAFPKIIFKINNTPAYLWAFESRHFQLEKMKVSLKNSNPWLVPYNKNLGDWLPISIDELNFFNETYKERIPLSIIYNTQLRKVEGVLRAISWLFYETHKNKRLNQFMPFIEKWIDKTVPLNDLHSINKIGNLLYFIRDYDEIFIENLLSQSKYASINKFIISKNKNNKNKEFILATKLVDSENFVALFIAQEVFDNIKLVLAHNKSVDDSILNYLRKIKFLDLNYNSIITNDGLKYLSNLTSLNLNGNSKITNNGLKYLPNLTFLNLGNNSKITDDGLKQLINLTSLNLNSNSIITGIGLKKLINLTSLDLADNQIITDDELKYFPNLTSLNLNGNSTITDVGLKKLINLTSLNLSNNSKITNESLKHLSNLTSLILYNNSKITNESLRHLSNLTSLNLGDNSLITDDGLKYLSNLTSLILENNSRISNDGLKYLPNLTSLSLENNTIITDDGLKTLKKLEKLNLKFNTKITLNSVEYLLENLKEITTVNMEILSWIRHCKENENLYQDLIVQVH